MRRVLPEVVEGMGIVGLRVVAGLLVVSGLLSVAGIAGAQVAKPGGAQSTTPASPAAGDQRVKAALDKLGLIYTVSPKGNFKLIYDLEGGRTQQVVVYSVTEVYQDFEIREVTATAYRSNGSLSAELANRLLDENAIKKLGAWRVFREDPAVYVEYALQIPADAEGEYLRAAIEFSMVEADRLENELTPGKDEF